MSQGQGRQVGLDVLRAVAALLVVATHTTLDLSGQPAWTHPVGWLFRSGGTGVELFLVISGYSIAGRWADRRDERGRFPVRAFWVRRFLRLYPTFWVASVVCLLLFVAAVGWQRTADVPRPWLWFSGEVPWPVQALGYATVVTANVVPLAHMGRAWSLALEEQLYALFTLVQARWPRRVSPVRLLVGGLVVDVGYRLVVLLARPGWGAPSTLPVSSKELFLFFQVPALAAAWLAGWVLAEARRGRVAVPALLRSRLLAGLLFAAAVLLQQWGGPVWQLPADRVLAPVDVVLDLVVVAAFFVLVAAVALDDKPLVPPRPTRLLAWIGTWAYSLYLVHPAALRLVDERLDLPTVARVLTGWALSLLLAWLLWITVERHWVARASRVGRPALQGVRA